LIVDDHRQFELFEIGIFFLNHQEIKKKTMSINAFTKGGDQRNGKRGGSFQYTNKIQCRSCKQFGHDLTPTMVCRFGAQLHFATAFLAAHPDAARRNAIQFDNANKLKIINRLQLTCPDVNNVMAQDEHQVACEAFAVDIYSMEDNRGHSPPDDPIV